MARGKTGRWRDLKIWRSCRTRSTGARSERGINDYSKGDSAGFGSHGNQCPGRDRLYHRGDLPSGSRGASRLDSNGGVAAIGDVRAARIIPLALFTLAATYKRATSALLILGTLAGGTQLL